MTGLPSAFSVQLSLGGVWVDATPWVVGESGGSPTFHAGRPNEFSDVDTSTLTFALRNEDGRWTPRVSTSPYAPNLQPGVRVQVSVTHASTTYPVWGGKVITWSPSWPGFGVTDGIVTVTAACYLQDMTNIALEDRWTEDARAITRAQGTWCDIPDLTGQSSTVTTLVNGGITSTTLGACAIGSGTPSFGTPAGSVTLGKSVTGADVSVVPQGAPGTIDLWVKIPAAPVSSPVIGQAFPLVFLNAGSTLFSVFLQYDSGPQWDIVVRAGTYPTIATVAGNVNTDDWWRISLAPLAGTPTSTVVTVTDASTVTAYSTTVAYDMRTVTQVLTGGTYGGIETAGVVVTGGSTPLVTARGLSGQTAPAAATFAALMSYCPTVPASNYNGLENLTIGEPTWAGQTALLVLQQIARTIGGIGWCRPDGTVELIAGDVAYPVTPAGTLDVAGDIDTATTAPTFIDTSTEQPTRVTVTFPTGSVQVLNPTAESLGKPRREKNLITCALNAATATTIGQYQLAVADAMRIGQITVDLYSTVNDVWALMLLLYPTTVLNLSGWPTAMVGASTYQMVVQGWTITPSEESWLITMDGSPAGTFTSAAWDAGDAYGRWDLDVGAQVTGGTAVGTTGTGTIVVTTAATPLSTAAGDYPMTLLWESEAVVIPSPPGSSTSPQTLTIGTRGADGTTAVAHTTATSIDVWHPAVWGGLI